MTRLIMINDKCRLKFIAVTSLLFGFNPLNLYYALFELTISPIIVFTFIGAFIGYKISDPTPDPPNYPFLNGLHDIDPD